jgi:hypothetical protein
VTKPWQAWGEIEVCFRDGSRATLEELFQAFQHRMRAENLNPLSRQEAEIAERMGL